MPAPRAERTAAGAPVATPFNMDAAAALDAAATQLLGRRAAGRVIEVHPDTYGRWLAVCEARGTPVGELVVLGVPVRAVASVEPGDARVTPPIEPGERP